MTKQSLAVAADNPELLIFPLLSAFILFVLDAPFFPQLARLPMTKPDPSVYGLLLVLYCASDFVIIFFNSALMAAVAMQLDGNEATLGDGLRAASRWIMEILAWSLIAGTVGLVIQVVADRFGKERRLLGNIIDSAWSMATFFIIPVIIFEGQSDVRALRRSAELFKRQWGTQVAGRLGLSAVFFAFAVPALVLSLLTALVAPALAVAVAGMSALLLYLLHEAAEGVFVVALYRYATTGSGAGAFTADMLHAAFAPREPAWTEVDLSSIHGQAERRLGTWQDLGGTFGTDTGAAGAPPAGSTR